MGLRLGAPPGLHFCSLQVHPTLARRSVLVVNRHDEIGLACEIEPPKIVSLGLEDHDSRSHAALKPAIAYSRLAA